MPADKVEKYDLWRPVVRPERRDALDHLHQNVAVAWCQHLPDSLGSSATIAFEGSSFEPFLRLCDTENAVAEVAAFVLERAQVSGLLLISSDLVQDFIDIRLGAPGERFGHEAPGFTLLETAIAREVATSLFGHLNHAYAATGLGELKVTRHANALRDLGAFDPEDYLVVFRYAVSGANIAGRIVVALGSTVVNAVVDSTAASKTVTHSPQLRSQIAMLPVDTEVLLGSWTVPLQELLELRPGDVFPLPGGDEGVLMTGGRRLQSLEVEFEPQLIRLRAQRRFEHHEKD